MDDANTTADPPSEEEVRAALTRIIQSSTFRVSRQLVAFLRFVVEADLAGQQSRIKSYTIAVEALGRSASFDPQSDAGVRVEAARLRRTLERYYAGPGARDPIIIEIPRGRYVPSYRRRDRMRDPIAANPLRRRAAALFVPPMQRLLLKFEDQLRRCRAVAGLD